METQFAAGPVFAEGTVAVQVIVLVQPPVSLEDAPLRETLKAVLAAPVARRVLALGGAGEDWLPAGFDLIAQRGGDQGERMGGGLARAFAPARARPGRADGGGARRRLRHGGAPHAAAPGGRPGNQRGHD